MSNFRRTSDVSYLAGKLRKNTGLTTRTRLLRGKISKEGLVRRNKKLASTTGTASGAGGGATAGSGGKWRRRAAGVATVTDTVQAAGGKQDLDGQLGAVGARALSAKPKRLAGRTAMRASTRAVSATSQALVALVRKIVAAISVKAATASVVVVAVLATVIAVVSILPSFIFAVDEEQKFNLGAVPTQYVTWVLQAGKICDEVTPSIIAAQIEAESNWNSTATSPAGAQGIAQFLPSTWASVGRDGNGDGKADIWNPADAIISQGHYLCGQITATQKIVGIRSLDFGLAAYNAGVSPVLIYGGIPPFPETQNYVAKIKNLAATKYAYLEISGYGDLPGDDYPWKGKYNTPNPATSYYYGNCTDFVFWRVNRDVGSTSPPWALPYGALTPRGGHGAQWGAPGNLPGWRTVSDPARARAGDVISFSRGVLGSSVSYGHVAYVAAASPDGTLLTENYGLGHYYQRTLNGQLLRQLIASGGVVIKHNPLLGQ